MVYAYDQWAQMPVKDLYDTQIMLAAVNAAKDMYEKGEQAIKDFRKDYGDFMSPFAYDTKWYNENFNVANKLGEIYSRGGDPLRNQADRAEIYRWINSRPYADYNNKKLRAANYQTYRKNMAELDAQGAYNPAMEQYYLQRLYGPKAVGDPSTWDLDAMGISSWDRLSPVRAKSLKELTESSYNNMTPHQLTKAEVLSFPGAVYDPRQTYTGTTYQDLLDVANTAAPGLRGTAYYDYYMNEAANKVAARGEDLTPENINKQLERDIANSQIEYLKQPVGNIDNWYKQQSLGLQRQRLAIAQARANKEQEDKLNGWTFRTKSGSFENSMMFNSGELLKRTRNTKNIGETLSIGSAYYSSRQKQLEGPDLVYGMLLAANYADKENIGLGENQKRRPIMFDEDNLSLKTDRVIDHLNSSATETGKYILKRGGGLQNFLKRNHIQGYIPTESASVVWDRSGGNDVYDVNFTTRIKKSDIEKYLGADKDKTLKYLGEKYGLTLVKKNGQIVKPGDKNASSDTGKMNHLEWNEVEWIDIPTVRTIFANELDNQMIDSHADAVTFTKATGAKRQAGYLYDDSNLDLE